MKGYQRRIVEFLERKSEGTGSELETGVFKFGVSKEQKERFGFAPKRNRGEEERRGGFVLIISAKVNPVSHSCSYLTKTRFHVFHVGVSWGENTAYPQKDSRI